MARYIGPKAKLSRREGTDLFAVRGNFVSVTPLQLDLTAHELRARLAEALE